MIAGDCNGYLTLFLETGTGLHNTGHLQRDSVGILVDIKVTANSFPFINDWDEDGRKDMIVGESECELSNSGNVRVYLNIGTNTAPAFADYILIHTGPDPIFINHSHPVVFDLDADGLKDLIIGNQNGYVYLFHNINTNEAPRFAAAYDTLQTVENVFIDAVTLSRINCVDWTEDGDLDLLIGGELGYVQLCENARFPAVCEHTGSFPNTGCLRVIQNPVYDKVLIEYSVNETSCVTLGVYSSTGRLIAEICNQTRPSGRYCHSWLIQDSSGNRIPAGAYFIWFQAGSEYTVVKFIIVP